MKSYDIAMNFNQIDACLWCMPAKSLMNSPPMCYESHWLGGPSFPDTTILKLRLTSSKSHQVLGWLAYPWNWNIYIYIPLNIHQGVFWWRFSNPDGKWKFMGNQVFAGKMRLLSDSEVAMESSWIQYMFGNTLPWWMFHWYAFWWRK